MIQRLKYWLFQKGKGCKRCCLRCEYYDICRWDVQNGSQTTKGKTIDILAVEVARGGSRDGLLFRICQYVELKQKERRDNEKL